MLIWNVQEEKKNEGVKNIQFHINVGELYTSVDNYDWKMYDYEWTALDQWQM